MWADLYKEGDKVKMKGMAQCLADWMSRKKCFEGSCSGIMVV